jgi:urea transporter
LLCSYGQVFFSDNPWFAGLLIATSLIDPQVGFSGMLSVVVALLFAMVVGLNKTSISKGIYTYNVLLTGFAMGAYFECTLPFIGILCMASLLTLFISVCLSGLMAKYRLPFLSLPFVLSVWILLLNTRSFDVQVLLPRNVFIHDSGWNSFVFSIDFYLESLNLPGILIIYLKAMGSIFFQHSLLAGILITIGLLIHSRITFALSWLGFATGFLFFRYVQGNMISADYETVSFNYIFTAIALGGFFYIPSAAGFLLVLFSTCITGLLITAINKMTGVWLLPAYSLPFSAATILLIAVLNNRLTYKYLHPAFYQQYSPEKNLYAFHIYMGRFSKNVFTAIQLPFFGEWTVSQGHSGAITHKDDFRYAWDFVVTDEHSKTFRLPGKTISDFYCYGLPITAPADGQVVTILNGIDDNAVGGVNLNENWGNSIVLKHSEFLYSKISHIKNDSFKVKEGDHVKRGDLIANCGNSGRSPEPHIHFQLQESAYIGAATIRYPLSHYVVKTPAGNEHRSFEHPKENEILFRPVANAAVKKAFEFIPGMKFRFETDRSGIKCTESWEVITDSSNASYIYCRETGSSAWFTYDDTVFYFTSFSGDKKSLLFYFYLAAYKVFFSPEASLVVKDSLPAELFSGKAKKWLMDFISPFYIFKGPVFSSQFIHDPLAEPGSVTIASRAGINGTRISFGISLQDNKLNTLKIMFSDQCIYARSV